MPLALGFAALLVVALGGCRTKIPHPAPACTEGTAQVVTALRAAPRPVRLRDGTRLSRCVDAARDDADLQNVGAVLTGAADAEARDLAGDAAAAVRLGYLVGAVRRGGAHTNGIHAELVRRIEQTAGLDGPTAARRAAYARGLAAGEQSG